MGGVNQPLGVPSLLSPSLPPPFFGGVWETPCFQLIHSRPTVFTQLLSVAIGIDHVNNYQSFSPRGPIYKSLSLDHKVLKNFQGVHILQTVSYV